MNFKNLCFIIILSLFAQGCASFGQSLKAFLNGEPQQAEPKVQAKKTVGKVDKTKNYKRMDHQTLQEKSNLGAEAGSLWVERGQGSYLFAQNTNRLIGDLINVEIDGQPKKQIETKVGVIQNLLDQIKAQTEQRQLASEENPATAGAPAAPSAAGGKDQGAQKFDIKTVPSRIVEILKDGSYVVQGDQIFMIGKREYKLIVKGIVRQEDFDDQGISAETLLDPNFDIVTHKRTKTL